MSDERLVNTNITEIMESAYINYSMSVIVSRALPDARDGLKPVQRRILYAMLREGLLHNRPFDKCAGVVGEVLKNYHPHGDGSVYDTLVRLAQPWVMRYPLIDPQGNFGSVDGDAPAAYRYTECRLTSLAEEMLKDIDAETVDFVPNYKESTTEPSVLPASFPELLVNGSTGIAVGMTTNIPPHNLRETIDAVCLVIDNPQASIDDIMQVLPGPDFPTGGTINGRSGIDSYMRTGRGIVRMKGTIDVEENSAGKEYLVVTEIPYNVNRATLVSKIADLVNDKVIEGVSEVRDESDENTRVVIELKRGEIPRVVINKLFKHTALESSFGVILLALDNRRPKQMNIREVIQCYVDHRREVIFRRTSFLLRKAEARAHILEGYRIALDNLDDFVKIIRASASRDQARERLMEKYPISERQANAILELRLYQLTGLERDKIEAEYAEIMERIKELRAILENEQRLLGVIKDELIAIRDKYSDERRSIITAAEGEMRMEDLIANEGCIITVTHKGFIKRSAVDQYRSQKRGGKGVIGAGSHDEDYVEHLFTASTHDTILFFMDNGRVYLEKVYMVPEGQRTGKGRMIANFLELREDERVASMICIKGLEEDIHFVAATRKGVVKKTHLSEYKHIRKGGTIGIKIDEDDELCKVVTTTGDDELIIVTKSSQAVRFHEDELRAQGRATRGVTGVRFKNEDDEVRTLEVINHEETLLTLASSGMGKRTAFDEYRKTARGTKGVTAMKADVIVGALSVSEEDEIMAITQNGQTVRMPVKDIRIIGRATQGVRCLNLANGDSVIGVSKIVEIDEEEA
ncbi:MAG: DNA gyrase subunit A [Verrucomicrobiota bacterium]